MSQYQQIHQQALHCAKAFHRAESELLSILQQVDAEKVYRHFGYSSLFVYATQALRLSESNAYAFIAVSRKSFEVPQIAEAIAKGTLTVSKAKRVTSVILPENQKEWIEKAQSLSQRDLEREVVKHHPKAAVRERFVPIAENRSALHLAISDSLEGQLKRAQDILSQNKKRPVGLEEALEEITKLFLEKKDPLLKAERVFNKATRKTMNKKVAVNGTLVKTPSVRTSEAHSQQPLQKIDTNGDDWIKASRRRGIPAAVRHQVNLRDRGKCGVCQSSRWLEFHHRTPVSRGGPDTPENLVTLCSAHHRMRHEVSRSRRQPH